MFPFLNRKKTKVEGVPAEWLDHDLLRVNYVVIDCEMTGLNPKKDKLLSIGAVRVQNGEIDLNGAFYETIFQEERFLKKETINIHQISHQDVSEGRRESVVLSELSDFVGNSITMGHFFKIDLNFLRPLLKNDFLYPSLDTRLMTEYLLKRKNPLADFKDQLQLTRLANKFDIPLFSSHHALSNAMTTACLFLKVAKKLREEKIISLRSLYELAQVD